jgi:Flp pilus assembly protein TadD
MSATPSATLPECGALLRRGASLLETGELEPALATFEEGAQRFPREWRFACNAATVLHRQGRLGEAIRRANQALALAPAVALVHLKLGTWLLEAEQPGPALRLFERAARLPDAGLDELLHLGVAWLETKELARALAVAEEAVARSPDEAEAHTLLGLVLAARGERAASDAALRRALELDPTSAQAAYHLARRGVELDPAPLRAAFEDGRLLAAKRSKLAFALGHIHDRRGETELAFACFTRANELAGRRFDPERHAAEVAAVIEASGPALFARAARQSPDPAPIFIVGLPRTGSTLLEQILAAHPRVHAVGEHAQGLPRLARELHALRPRLAPFPRGLLELTPQDEERLAARYLASLPPAAAAGLRPLDKLLANSINLGLVARLFPSARILHARRDPRDSALSTYFLEFQRNELPWSYDLAHIAAVYREHARLMRHWREHLPLPILDVDHEELVAQPEAVTRRILAFVGLEWDERCLTPQYAKRPVFTASALQVRETLHARGVGRWRAYAKHLGGFGQSGI